MLFSIASRAALPVPHHRIHITTYRPLEPNCNHSSLAIITHSNATNLLVCFFTRVTRHMSPGTCQSLQRSCPPRPACCTCASSLYVSARRTFCLGESSPDALVSARSESCETSVNVDADVDVALLRRPVPLTPHGQLSTNGLVALSPSHLVALSPGCFVAMRRRLAALPLRRAA
jgi:hypothetical protein